MERQADKVRNGHKKEDSGYPVELLLRCSPSLRKLVRTAERRNIPWDGSRRRLYFALKTRNGVRVRVEEEIMRNVGVPQWIMDWAMKMNLYGYSGAGWRSVAKRHVDVALPGALPKKGLVIELD
jgi:hypothetical protein